MNSQGQLTLGASNTFTGTTQINSGQVVMGVPDALAKNTVVINANNGLNLNNHEFPTIGGLSGSGSLYLGDVFPTQAPAALPVGGNNASTTYSGTITTGGVRWLDKQGTGPLTLSGFGSSFYMIRMTNGAVILDGGSITAALELGDFGNSTPVTIQNGAVVDSRGQQINGIMGNSTVRVTGVGTIWRAGDTRLAFAQGTSGNAIFENGATVTDSTKFIVGQGGPATLLLQSGATITTQVGAIGQNNPAFATATVPGPGSTWTNSTSLSLGGIPPGITGGTGTLNINNGGQVISGGPTIIYTASSAIKVNGGALLTGSLVSDPGIGLIDLTDPAAGDALAVNSVNDTGTFNVAQT